jgi:chitin disaccharide deacetylase
VSREGIVINADDFGRSTEINQAVAQAHRHGILTSASLMVTGEAAEEAVCLARSMPTLAVGLHVVLTEGRPALPVEEAPHLVDRHGQFPASPVRAGLRYAFSGAARRELALEVEAQFQRFAATGLPLAHVDSHQHIHLHPAVLGPVMRLARQHAAGRVRLTRDNLRLSLRFGWHQAGRKIAYSLLFGLLSRLAAIRLRRQGVATTTRSYGLMQTGDMHERYVLEVLRRLTREPVEIYFHPTAGPRLAALGPNPGDLQTLLSPAVRSALNEARAKQGESEATRSG